MLPVEDAEISAFMLKRRSTKQGMTILTGVVGREALSRARPRGCARRSITGDADARRGVRPTRTATSSWRSVSSPNSENIGLEALGVENRAWAHSRRPTVMGGPTSRGCGRSATSPARRGSRTRLRHEGVIAVEAIADVKGKHPMDMCRTSPAAPTRRPQVASCGADRGEARWPTGYKVKVGRFPFIGNGKAIALGESRGAW